MQQLTDDIQCVLIFFCCAFYFSAIIISSCKSHKHDAIPDCIIGVREPDESQRFHKHSLGIAQPYVVVRYWENSKLVKDSITGVLTENVILNILGHELNRETFYDIPKVIKIPDFKCYDGYGPFYMAMMHPEWKVKIPEQIAIPNEKYAVLVDMSIRENLEGKRSGHMDFSIINSQGQYFEQVKRLKLNTTPLDSVMIHKYITKVLSEFVVEL